jgi:hypothetical protein
MKNTITKAIEVGVTIGITLEYFNLVVAAFRKTVCDI